MTPSPRLRDFQARLTEAIAAGTAAHRALDRVRELLADAESGPPLVVPAALHHALRVQEQAERATAAVVESLHALATEVFSPRAEAQDALLDEWEHRRRLLLESLDEAQHSFERARAALVPVLAEQERVGSSVAFRLAAPSMRARAMRPSRPEPRWSEGWPSDAELAASVLRELAKADGGAGGRALDQRDLSIAHMRWDEGLSQAQIGERVSLSQPSVAARLQRIEQLISLEVAVRKLRLAADRERPGVRTHFVRSARSESAQLQVEGEDVVIRLDVLLAPEDGRSTAQIPLPDADLARRYVQAMDESSTQSRRRLVFADCMYDQSSGSLAYYSKDDVVKALEDGGDHPGGPLGYLRDLVVPALTLTELIERDAQQRRSRPGGDGGTDNATH
jgi:hypothetical protein